MVVCAQMFRVRVLCGMVTALAIAASTLLYAMTSTRAARVQSRPLLTTDHSVSFYSRLRLTTSSVPPPIENAIAPNSEVRPRFRSITFLPPASEIVVDTDDSVDQVPAVSPKPRVASTSLGYAFDCGGKQYNHPCTADDEGRRSTPPNPSSSSSQPPFFLLTYATHNAGEFCAMLHSAIQNRLHVHILGWSAVTGQPSTPDPTAKRGIGFKLVASLEFLKGLVTQHPEAVVMFVDAFDSLFAHNTSHILPKFVATKVGCFDFGTEICFDFYGLVWSYINMFDFYDHVGCSRIC